MTPFGPDPRPTLTDVTTIDTPLGDVITFDRSVNHRVIGSGWASWSHGYTGDVYYTNGSFEVTITLPDFASGFYFYVEPNPFVPHPFEATAGGVTAMYEADGSGGAAYCGFYGSDLPGGDIRVVCTGGVDFAIGEFGITDESFGADCNGNGIPDECDILPPEGYCQPGLPGYPEECSENCQPDDVPDECQLEDNDCQPNGIPDECDIADGTSIDCQPDGVPDECEPDCNENGVADECDIRDGTSEDCNENGVPDECDIADGTSEDCQPDDIPDECQLFDDPCEDGFRDAGDLLLSQPPNQSNGIFSDCDCDFCGQPQVLADDFVLDEEVAIGLVRVWGGHYPGDGDPSVHDWTVTFYADAGGAVGDELWTSTGPATNAELTGVVLFGVQEWMIEFELADPLPPVFAAGTYHIAVYTNSVDDPDSWFWEVGNDDAVHGINGSWFLFACPPVAPWNRDTANDFALELVEGQAGPPPNDCNENGVPDECDVICDLDQDGDVDEDDYEIFRAAFGTVVGDPTYNYCAETDCTDAIGMGDYANWLSCYREFIGSPTAPPPGAPPMQEETRPDFQMGTPPASLSRTSGR
jgi:hypothetical protein